MMPIRKTIWSVWCRQGISKYGPSGLVSRGGGLRYQVIGEFRHLSKADHQEPGDSTEDFIPVQFQHIHTLGGLI